MAIAPVLSAVVTAGSAQFATGLNQAFMGTVLCCVGILMFSVGRQFPPLMIAAMLSFVGGWIVVLMSKRHCYGFAAPIAGRWYISLAYWLDMAAIVVRLFRGPPLATLLLTVCGEFCFLAFLIRLNSITQRPKLQWLGMTILVTWLAFATAMFALHVGLHRNGGPLIALLILSVFPLTLTSFIAFMVLVRRTAMSLVALAAFLDSESANPASTDVSDDAEAFVGEQL